MNRELVLMPLTTACLAGVLVCGFAGTASAVERTTPASARSLPTLQLNGGTESSRLECWKEWSPSCPYPGEDPTGPNETSVDVCGTYLAKDPVTGEQWNVDTCGTFTTDWNNGEVEHS